MSQNVVIVSEMENTLQRGHGKVTTEQQQTTEVMVISLFYLVLL